VKSSTRRLLTYGSNASLVTVIVLLVLVLVYALADQFRARADLSEGAQNTLLADTLARLRLLDTDGQTVEITAFTAQSGKPESWYKNRTMNDLLEELDRNSNVIKWRQVDFDKERLTAEKLGVTQYGQVVIQRGADRVDIKDRDLFKRKGKVSDNQWSFLGETAIDRGLAQLLTPSRRVVYVLSGHGDLDPEEQGPDGLSNLADALDQERFEVQQLDLLRTGREGEAPDVPEDASVVFVARPKADLTAQETDILLAWLGRGMPILFAVDVGFPVPSMLSRLGVSVPDGLVLDREMLFPYRDRPLPRYKSHPIVDGLRDDGLATVMAAAAPIEVSDPPPEGVHATPLLVTSRDGWIERGGSVENGLAQYDKEIDGAGPVNFAVALEVAGGGLVRQGKQAARVLVVGDGDVFTNALFDEGPGNSVFAVNAIEWLAGDDKRLSVNVRRTAEVRRLALTEEEQGTLRWLSLAVMPSLVLVAGLMSWWSRRGR